MHSRNLGWFCFASELPVRYTLFCIRRFFIKFQDKRFYVSEQAASDVAPRCHSRWPRQPMSTSSSHTWFYLTMPGYHYEINVLLFTQLPMRLTNSTPHSIFFCNRFPRWIEGEALLKTFTSAAILFSQCLFCYPSYSHKSLVIVIHGIRSPKFLWAFWLTSEMLGMLWKLHYKISKALQNKLSRKTLCRL